MEPFTLPYKLIGPQNYIRWRIDFRRYLSRHGLLRLLDDGENKTLMVQMRDTIDEQVYVPEMTKISHFWNYLEMIFLHQCKGYSGGALWDMMDDDFKLQRAIHYSHVGKSFYQERRWAEAETVFRTVRTIVKHVSGAVMSHNPVELLEAHLYLYAALIHKGEADVHENRENLEKLKAAAEQLKEETIPMYRKQIVLNVAADAFIKAQRMDDALDCIDDIHSICTSSMQKFITSLKYSTCYEVFGWLDFAYRICSNILAYSGDTMSESLHSIFKQRIVYLRQKMLSNLEHLEGTEAPDDAALPSTTSGHVSAGGQQTPSEAASPHGALVSNLFADLNVDAIVSLSSLPILLSAEGGENLQIRAQLMRIANKLLYILLLENKSESRLYGFEISFGANTYGIEAFAPLEQVPALLPGQSCRIHLPVAVFKHSCGGPARRDLWVGITCHQSGIGPLSMSFTDMVPLNVLLDENGRIEPKQFVEMWRSLPACNEVSKELTNIRLASFGSLHRIFDDNIFHIATQTYGKSQLWYFCAKITSEVFFLGELVLCRDERKLLCRVISSRPELHSFFFDTIENILRGDEDD